MTLLIGLPGSDKTMLAKRLPTNLPRLSIAESLEITRIHFVAGGWIGSWRSRRQVRKLWGYAILLCAVPAALG